MMAEATQPQPAQSSSEPRHLILGTAGHIDHGKTSLVRALTGIDTDRLPQEKARGMTIELGFAHFDVPGVQFGIVDVPGHERFVRTMVAGATGIDLALFIVAADDGVMPQTREHAEILDLLGVHAGVIAITKADLVDAGRVVEVRRQLIDLLDESPLTEAPMIAVSSETGQGLDELRAALAALAAALPPRRASSLFRLGIDRVFSVHGRGTVVTGSILAGQVQRDTQLELLPRRVRCRVRELQTHGQAATGVGAGQRAALNLTNIDRNLVQRGHELATPDSLTPTRVIDVRYRHLAAAPRALDSFTRVRLAMSTFEVMALAVVLDADVDAVSAGAVANVQLRLREPIVCAHGQPFIIRDETASRTIGGGRVLRCASRRLSRRHVDDLAGLDALRTGDSAARVAEVLRFSGFEGLPPTRIATATSVDSDEVEPLIEQLEADGTLLRLDRANRPIHAGALNRFVGRARRWLESYHVRKPTEPGCLTDTFVGWLARRSRKSLGRVLASWMIERNHVVARGRYVCHPDFQPALSPQDETLLDAIVAELQRARFQPPALEALSSAAGQPKERLQRLAEVAKAHGKLVGIDETVMLHADRYDELQRIVAETIREKGQASVSAIRQALDSTRKFVVPMLEHLDKINFTRRRGNDRVLTRPGGATTNG